MDPKKGARFLEELLSTAVNKFNPMIDQIYGCERTMSSYAQKATDQLSIYYQEVGLQNQGSLLKIQQVMKADFATIKDVPNTHLEMQKVHEQRIKELVYEIRNMKKMKTPLDKAKEDFEKNKRRVDPSTAPERAFERSKTMRLVGTCEWIFELDEYKQWRTSSENSILWGSGVGEMGKSGAFPVHP